MRLLSCCFPSPLARCLRYIILSPLRLLLPRIALVSLLLSLSPVPLMISRFPFSFTLAFVLCSGCSISPNAHTRRSCYKFLEILLFLAQGNTLLRVPICRSGDILRRTVSLSPFPFTTSFTCPPMCPLPSAHIPTTLPPALRLCTPVSRATAESLFPLMASSLWIPFHAALHQLPWRSSY